MQSSSLLSYGNSNSHKLRGRFEIHSRASGDAECTFAIPPGSENMGHLFTICSMVWRSPHSHCGESLIRHLCIRYAHLPCDVLMRLMVAHCPRRSEKPGGSAVGSSMRCLFLTSDPAHCIRQASSGLKLDARRAFPAAQNGRRDLRRVRGGRTRSA